MSEIINPYLQRFDKQISQSPARHRTYYRNQFDFIAAGGEIAVDPIAVAEDYSLRPYSELASGMARRLPALSSFVVGRGRLDGNELKRDIDKIERRLAHVLPTTTIDGMTYYDEAHPSFSPTMSLLQNLETALVVDGLKVAKRGRTSTTVHSNAVVSNYVANTAFDVIAKLGPRSNKGVRALRTRLGRAKELFAEDSPLSYDELWVIDKMYKHALMYTSASDFYNMLEGIDCPAGMTIEFLQEYSDELFAEVLINAKYGVKDAVGSVEIKELGYNEIQFTRNETVEAAAETALRLLRMRGKQPMAVAVMTTGTFASTHLIDESYQAKGGIKADAFVFDISHDESRPKPDVYFVVCNDGQLYDINGVALKEKASMVGGELEYELIRAEIVNKFYDLTVPLYVDDGKNDTELNNPKTDNPKTVEEEYWSELRLRRRKISVNNQATDDDVDVVGAVKFQNVIWHYRDLPKGYRATSYAIDNHRLAMLENGLNYVPMPEGVTFVKSHTRGDETQAYKGTRIKVEV